MITIHTDLVEAIAETLEKVQSKNERNQALLLSMNNLSTGLIMDSLNEGASDLKGRNWEDEISSILFYLLITAHQSGADLHKVMNHFNEVTFAMDNHLRVKQEKEREKEVNDIIEQIESATQQLQSSADKIEGRMKTDRLAAALLFAEGDDNEH